MNLPVTSLYQQHVACWGECQACELQHDRKQVVLARGTIPCDVVFVGEAPGESEDVLGKPFMGPAGQLLDHIISRSRGSNTWTYALTNLVCCIPRDRDDGAKAAQPPDAAIEACSPRLTEFIDLCNPWLIVCVGAMARDWLEPGYNWSIPIPDIPRVDITHPAAILRANVSQQGLAIQRCVVTIRNAVEDHVL